MARKKLEIISYATYRDKRVRVKNTREFRNKECELYKKIGELQDDKGIRVVNFKDANELRDFAVRVNQNLPNPDLPPYTCFKQIIDDSKLIYLIRRLI